MGAVLPVRRAAALVLAEGLLLGVLAVGYAVLGLDEAGSVAQVLLLSLVVLLTAAGVLLLGRGLARLRRWARGPVVTVQLLTLLAIGIPSVANGFWLAAVPAVLLPAAVLYLLFRPEAQVAFGAEPDEV